MSLKWIIFDFHGVLADLGPAEPWVRAAVAVDVADLVERLETGRMGMAEFLHSLPRDAPFSGGRFKLAVRQEMVGRVRSLRSQGFRVALLTNSFRGSAGMRDNAGISDDIFDVVIESWMEGVRKPDRAIFLRTLARLGSAAHECLFIDDQPQNVLSARKLGFQVIQAGTVADTLRAIDAHCGLADP